MRFSPIKDTLVRTVGDVQNNHTMAMAAGLSYYFVLSLFPMLIVASAIVPYLPVPNLFDQALDTMARIVPAEGMGLVRAIVRDVIGQRHAALLSVGILGSLWTVSGGFQALIEALDVAYDVPETRSWQSQRLLALGMALLVGALTLLAFAVIVVGPKFGGWFAGHVGLGPQFAQVWPIIRWSIAITFTVLAVEFMYFLGPNVRQPFLLSLPGALIAVGVWIGLSYGLGIYFQHFANFNKTYGTLGAGIALLVWLYWSGFAILLGAEINSEAIQVTSDGKLALKRPPPRKVYPKEPPKEADEAA